MSNSAYEPTVPPKARDIVYWVGFIVGGLSLLVTGLAAIWVPDYATQVTATALVIGNATAWVAAGLGVVYRPGVQEGNYEARYKLDG